MSACGRCAIGLPHRLPPSGTNLARVQDKGEASWGEGNPKRVFIESIAWETAIQGGGAAMATEVMLSEALPICIGKFQDEPPLYRAC